MLMKIIVAWLAVMLLVSMVHGCKANEKRGIHSSSKDVVLITGECVVMNWSTSEEDIEAALQEWMRLRK